MTDRMPYDDHEKDLDGEVQEFLDGLATEINNLGEDIQLDVLEHGDFIRGALLGKSVARAQDWKRRLEDALLQMRDVYDSVMDVYTLMGGSQASEEKWRKLREWEKTFLETKFSYLAEPWRRSDHLRLAHPSGDTRKLRRLAGVELRVKSALKKLGLGAWLGELEDIVERPEVDDFHWLRGRLKEHLKDDRVGFLRGDDTPRGTRVPKADKAR